MSNITTDFINATKKIHADVRAAVLALKSIGNDVKTIKEKGRAYSNDGETKDAEGSASTVQPDKKNLGPYEGKQHALDKLRFRLEKKTLHFAKWSLIVLAIYTGFTGYQSYQNGRAADAARIAADAATSAAKTADQTLRMQQRARLTISFPPATNNFGSPTFVHAVLTNTGATPSKKMAGAIFVKFVNLAEHMTFDLHREWDTKNDGIAIGQHALYPNVPANLPLPLQSVDPLTKIRTPVPYTRDMDALISEGKYSIVIFGRIEYGDVFSDQHWLTFCYFGKNKEGENKSVAQKDCSDYNDIDN